LKNKKTFFSKHTLFGDFCVQNAISNPILNKPIVHVSVFALVFYSHLKLVVECLLAREFLIAGQLFHEKKIFFFKKLKLFRILCFFIVTINYFDGDGGLTTLII
jgi:hypothetical protein